MKIQAIIACVDSGVCEGLLQMDESEGSWAAHTRLAKLSDVDVDHTSLWQLNPHHGFPLEPEEYGLSVRLWLGSRGAHPHLPSLFRQNISNTPIVWGASGRPHQDTLTVLRSSATLSRLTSCSREATLEHHVGRSGNGAEADLVLWLVADPDS